MRELVAREAGCCSFFTFTAAVEAGCDDLTARVGSACRPLPFTDLAEENRHAAPRC
ncbi:hypothetical protein OG429_32790 [Streptomyces sp. NBC_00190]|uniref:hypothetical protein n=1 Tax=unclassified Streptomyces TaxID=2593676 RepID=UPI002E2D6FF3|nr:hypothetical protein [Streptomyces sp. NBC_00190]WSZ43634.1 hypothetical protein OG239_35250 [Streptomyces sp. NBC_00868]